MVQGQHPCVEVVPLATTEDKTAQEYYDSEDAFHFYKEVWGGDNVHVGLYDEVAMKEALGPSRIRTASATALKKLVEKVAPKKGEKVMDMGSAYGGCARLIASRYGASVSCVDLSAKENERNREMTKDAGLDHLVFCPGERSFTKTGEEPNSFDLVLSMDSFLHAGQYREAAIAEAARVLKVGGHLVFTDIMQSDDCNVAQMGPVYKRIHLDDMGSPKKHQAWAANAGLTFVEFDDMSEQLRNHYGTVKDVLMSKNRSGALAGKISDEYINNMSRGLQSWVDQADNKNLAWGYLVFRKDGKKEQDNSKGSDWSEFTVERWRDAVYVNQKYFGKLCDDTCDFVIDIAKHMKLGGKRVSLCEVGCGTGEFIRPLADHFKCSIGVDFNANFIDFCNSDIPRGKETRMRFIHGDATGLVDLMRKEAPTHFHSDTKIVCCVGNTIGIIPQELRRAVYEQMAELAGPDGVVVIVYWNAKWFGDACQNFYHANPMLCGEFTGSSVDFKTTTLTTPCYRTHWTGVAEARQVIEDLGFEEIIIEEKGKGVLVAARAPSQSAAM